MSKIEFIKSEFFKVFRDYWAEWGMGDEGRVQHHNPIFNGRKTNCRSSLYSLVKILKVNSVIELGSWHYDGAYAMARAMDDNDISDGYIASYDIMRGGYSGDYIPPKSPRIKEGYLYPCNSSFDVWKYYNPNVVYRDFMNMSDEEIFDKNKNIIQQNMPKDGFQFCVIDSDHDYKGALNDLNLCKSVAASDAIYVIDDLFEDRLSDVRRFFDDLPYEKYDWYYENTQDYNKPLISLGIFTVNET